MPRLMIQYVLSALCLAQIISAHPLGHKRATPTIYDQCINSNEIALTFDDGPYDYLRQISDAFTNAQAKATFFFNGYNWDCIYEDQRISDIQYAYAAGHMIGSHTWSHADLATLNTVQTQDAMYRMEEAFSRILGIKPAFMRPPFGSYTQNTANVAATRGQALALWDWDAGDADGNSTTQSMALYDDIAADKVKNALVLEHETLQTTADTLVPYAINLFQSKGYKLVTLADCLGVSPYQDIGVPQTKTSAWTCDGAPLPGQGCSGAQCLTGTPVLSTATSSATSSSTTSSSATSSSATSSSATSSSATSSSATSSSATSSSTTSSSTSTTPTSTATDVPNQYIHPNGNTKKCLTATSATNALAVTISDCISGGSSSQSWTISGGMLKIYGNKCMDVSGGTQSNGNKIQIYDCNDASNINPNQAWTVATTGGTIQWTTHSSWCLDNQHGTSTNTQLWTCNRNGNQTWTFTTGPSTSGSSSSSSSPTSSSPASTPTPTSRYIHPNGNTAKCLTATSNTNALAVTIANCKSGSASQQWTVDSGMLKIYGNKCMDVSGGTQSNGNKIQIYDCNAASNINPNQAWTVSQTGGAIQWTTHSSWCLDNQHGDSTNTQLWTCNGNNNQKWTLSSA